jgi:hypothetical protein
MTNSDPFPVFDRRCTPRFPGQISAAYDHLALFNEIMSPATSSERRQWAKNRLLCAARGSPLAQNLLKRIDWYVRHPEIKTVPMNPNDIPTPPRLKRRQPSEETDGGYSMWDF